jgi:ribose 5-phosphate isomerase
MTCARLESHEVRIALVGLGGGRTISYFIANLPQITADVAGSIRQSLRSRQVLCGDAQ